MESVVHECIPAVLEIEEALSSIDKWAAPESGHAAWHDARQLRDYI